MGTQADYFAEHVMEPSEGCRIWPYSKSKGKYGSVYIDGKVQRVNILTCVAWRGPPPAPNLDAAHTCGNPACWAGEHLGWKTRRENLADRNEHGTSPRGTRNPNAKLDESDVRIIRARLALGETSATIARDYGVHPKTVSDIQNGKTWAWLNDTETGDTR